MDATLEQRAGLLRHAYQRTSTVLRAAEEAVCVRESRERGDRHEDHEKQTCEVVHDRQASQRGTEAGGKGNNNSDNEADTTVRACVRVGLAGFQCAWRDRTATVLLTNG